jgi:hypothetical protein
MAAALAAVGDAAKVSMAIVKALLALVSVVGTLAMGIVLCARTGSGQARPNAARRRTAASRRDGANRAITAGHARVLLQLPGA